MTWQRVFSWTLPAPAPPPAAVLVELPPAPQATAPRVMPAAPIAAKKERRVSG